MFTVDRNEMHHLVDAVDMDYACFIENYIRR